jgi:hypothetical protein
VRENETFVFHFFFGDAVAGRAGRDSLAAVGALEMAQETNFFRYRDMLALNDLRVTTCATEPLTAQQFSDMHVVIEEDVFLEDDLAVNEPLGVAALLEAGRVLDFRARPRVICIRHVL